MKFAIIPFQNNKIFTGLYGVDEIPMEWMLIEYTNLCINCTNFSIVHNPVMNTGCNLYIGSVNVKRILAYTGSLNPATALSYIKTGAFTFFMEKGFKLDKYFFEADTDEDAMLLFEAEYKL